MPHVPTWSVQTEWPADPCHVGDARRFVADRLAAGKLDHLADTAALIVSELATNAVRHAGTRFRVTVECEGDQLLLEVYDRIGGAVRRSDATDPDATSGRGLFLVGQLSSDWGVTPHRLGGKSVWARLDVAAGDRLNA